METRWIQNRYSLRFLRRYSGELIITPRCCTTEEVSERWKISAACRAERRKVSTSVFDGTVRRRCAPGGRVHPMNLAGGKSGGSWVEPVDGVHQNAIGPVRITGRSAIQTTVWTSGQGVHVAHVADRPIHYRIQRAAEGRGGTASGGSVVRLSITARVRCIAAAYRKLAARWSERRRAIRSQETYRIFLPIRSHGILHRRPRYIACLARSRSVNRPSRELIPRPIANSVGRDAVSMRSVSELVVTRFS